MSVQLLWNCSTDFLRNLISMKDKMCICISDSFFPWELCPFELRNLTKIIHTAESVLSAQLPWNRSTECHETFERTFCVNVYTHRLFTRGYAPFELRNLVKIKYTNKSVRQYNSSEKLNRCRENLLLQRRYCVNAQIHRKFSFWFVSGRTWNFGHSLMYNFVQFVWNRFSTYGKTTYYLWLENVMKKNPEITPY